MKRFGFGKRYCLDRNFIKRSAIVMNTRTNTQYFKLERGACQGDPVLEILFLFIKKHPEYLKYLNTASFMLHMQAIRCFFLKDAQSIENLVETFKTFSLFSGLKPNLTKC